MDQPDRNHFISPELIGIDLDFYKCLSEKSINSIFPNKPQRSQRTQRFFKRVSVLSVTSVVLTFRIGSK